MSRTSGSGGKIARALGGVALSTLRDALARGAPRERGERADVEARPDDPPVVAQLMIEIRSDGSRTIARGALHDLRAQESAHVHAEGRTPSQLVASLLGSLLSLPVGAFQQRARTAPEIDEQAPAEPLEADTAPEDRGQNGQSSKR